MYLILNVEFLVYSAQNSYLFFLVFPEMITDGLKSKNFIYHMALPRTRFTHLSFWLSNIIDKFIKQADLKNNFLSSFKNLRTVS